MRDSTAIAPATGNIPDTVTTSKLKLAPGIGQPILTDSRAVTEARPFVQKCANARVGDPIAKLILLLYASYVNVWTGYDGGVSLASQETIRVLCEDLGKRRFREKLRYLFAAGFLLVRQRGRGMTAQTFVFPAPALLAVKGYPPGGTARVTPRGVHERPVVKTRSLDKDLDLSEKDRARSLKRTGGYAVTYPCPDCGKPRYSGVDCPWEGCGQTSHNGTFGGGRE